MDVWNKKKRTNNIWN